MNWGKTEYYKFKTGRKESDAEKEKVNGINRPIGITVEFNPNIYIKNKETKQSN